MSCHSVSRSWFGGFPLWLRTFVTRLSRTLLRTKRIFISFVPYGVCYARPYMFFSHFGLLRSHIGKCSLEVLALFDNCRGLCATGRFSRGTLKGGYGLSFFMRLGGAANGRFQNHDPFSLRSPNRDR